MIDVDRIFGHPIFDNPEGYFSEGLHPKIVVLKELINRCIADANLSKVKCVVKIPLPSEGKFILASLSFNSKSSPTQVKRPLISYFDIFGKLIFSLFKVTATQILCQRRI